VGATDRGRADGLMALVVAADGGNSKTDLLVADTSGAVLARVRGDGTRPLDVGFDATVEALAALVGRALSEAGRAGERPAVASFYLANVDLPDEHVAMHDALSARGLADRLEVENDTLAVLRAGSRSGWGVGVVSGAGINAVGRTADGRIERFLGLGTITGDWGGGWGVAVAGIAAAVRAGDGRGAPTALRRLALETFGFEAEEVAVRVHRRQIREQRVFEFGPVVFAAADAGDDVAAGVVRHLGDQVTDYVRALCTRMVIGAGAVEVVLGGAALQSGNLVLRSWIEERVAAVAPGASVRVLDVPPVAGALVSALELAGAEPAAVAQARDALRPTVAS